MKKILGMILFAGVLFASITNTFLQHLRVNGIEDFNIKNGVLTVRQSGPVLKGKLLKEARANGINKIVYYVNLKDKAGFVIKEYAIKRNKLALIKTINPFKNIKISKYTKHTYSHTNTYIGGNYKVCKTNLTPNEEYYLTVQCNKLALGMVFNMKLQAEKFRQYGFNLVKANSIQEAATTMAPQEYQYMRIFKDICIKTRAVFCKNEKPATIILKTYLNNR